MKWSDKITVEIEQINNALASAGLNPEDVSVQDKEKIALEVLEIIRCDVEDYIQDSVDAYKFDKEWDGYAS